MFHCRRMEVRTDLYSLNLLAKLFVLHCQILFSLAMAAIIEAILMRISAVHTCAILAKGCSNVGYST